MLRELGQKQGLPMLVQLAHKVEAVVRDGVVSGADPFQKVKGMISAMLSKLSQQMEDETTHKIYCDKELKDSAKHKAVKETLQDKITTKIDTQSSRSMNLKGQVATLQAQLVENNQVQKEVDELRRNEHAEFAKVKPDLENGISGVKKALKVLRDFYSQDEDTSQSGAAGGAGAGVIGMLEVVESDLTKSLASLVEEEEGSQASYEEQTREGKVAKAMKDKEVTFKMKEAKGLDKSTSESSSDLDGVMTELDAIRQWNSRIQQECVAKPDSFEERRKRQTQMVEGLRNGLEVLGGKALLLQGSKRLRGIQRD